MAVTREGAGCRGTGGYGPPTLAVTSCFRRRMCAKQNDDPAIGLSKAGVCWRCSDLCAVQGGPGLHVVRRLRKRFFPLPVHRADM